MTRTFGEVQLSPGQGFGDIPVLSPGQGFGNIPVLSPGQTFQPDQGPDEGVRYAPPDAPETPTGGSYGGYSPDGSNTSFTPEISASQYCPDPPSEYGGDDCDLSSLLKDASKALRVLSDLLKLSKTITDAKARADFEKAVKDAMKKVGDGRQEMIEASNRLSYLSSDISGNNARINDLVSSLSSVQNNMSLELANIASITSSIAGIDSRLSTSASQLADAQARFDRAMNRANYAPGSTGLLQQRTDLRSANLDIFNINSTIADLQNTKANYITDMNTSGDRYNNLIPQANAVRDGVASAYQVAQDLEGQRASASDQYNRGGQTARDGYNDLLSAGRAYKDYQQNVAMPLTETASGSRGLSSMLNNFAEGNNYSGIADVMNTGLESTLRNSAPNLAPYGGFFTATISDAGKALDATARTGGDIGDAVGRFMVESGNRYLGVKDGIQLGQSVEKIYQFAGANDWQGVGMELESRAVPSALQLGSTLAQTGFNIMGMAPVSGALQAVTPGVISGASGGLSTLRNMTMTDISQPLTPSSPREIGRGLIERQTSGPPGALTVGAVGSFITAENIAKNTVGGMLNQNPNIASDLSVKISDMARSGVNWPGKLSPGTVTLRPVQPGVVAGD